RTIIVTFKGDTTNEADETFLVVLTNPVNATLSKAQGTCTILNDDPLPILNISNVNNQEGNVGTTSFDFTATLSAASGQNVTVDYATAPGTATSGVDYQSTSGTLTFTPGQTSKTVTVLVTGDTSSEANETFFVNLSNPTHATIFKAQGTGTINNDDVEHGSLQFSSASYTVNENVGAT